MSISLRIPMPAMGKARPRVTKRGTFMPEAYRQWLHLFKAHARSLYHGEPIHGAVSMTITFLSPTGNMRSDLDNAYGACADALQGIAYENDRQVKAGRFEIRRGKEHGIEVVVEAKE